MKPCALDVLDTRVRWTTDLAEQALWVPPDDRTDERVVDRGPAGRAVQPRGVTEDIWKYTDNCVMLCVRHLAE